MNPQDRFYRTMNTLLAPVRFVIDGIKVILFGLLLLGVALAWPLLMYMNHQPVTFGTFVVPLLAILFLFTFFCAPWYTVVGGILLLLGICGWALAYNFPDATETKWLWFLFFSVGLLQWYVRKPPTEPDPDRGKDAALRFCEGANEDGLSRKTIEYQNMGPLRRKTMTTLHGENYLNWPDD